MHNSQCTSHNAQCTFYTDSTLPTFYILHSTLLHTNIWTWWTRDKMCKSQWRGNNSIPKNSNSWSQCPILPTARLYHRTSLPVVLQVLEQVVIWVFLQPAYLDQMDPMWRQHALVQQCSDGWMEQHFVVWQNCQKDDKMTYIWFPPIPHNLFWILLPTQLIWNKCGKSCKIDIQH